MTNPSPTALEERETIRKRTALVRAAIDDTSAMEWDGTRKGQLLVQATQNVEILLTHIAALEAELVDKGERIGHWVKRVEQLEAQLATSLPDDPETDGTDAAHPAWWRGQERGVDGAAQSILNVIAKGRADGTAGSKLLQQAREQVVALLSGATSAEQSFDGTIHPDGTPNQVTASTWLSGAATEEQPRLHRITCKYWNGWGPCDCGAGAATPAPTAALTEEELLTPELIKKAADAGERVGWEDALTPNAQIYHRAIDLKKYETALRAVLPIITDRLAKSPPQGAEE